MTRDVVQISLIDKGWKCIGAGGFSYVLAHPEVAAYVYKISRIEDGFPFYINWAAENNYMGTKAPWVYRMQGCLDCTISKVERLKGDLYSLDKKTKEHVWHLYQQVSMHSPIAPPDWLEFMSNLRRAELSGDSWHPTNWMMRSNGDLVCNDPFAGKSNKRFMVQGETWEPRLTCPLASGQPGGIRVI